jgi:glycosyltransferase domain-containing protein
MTDERLTCVVPTHNRPHFLRRLLHLYRQFPPGFPFIIMDSSNPGAAAQNREVVESFRDVLSIDYQHLVLNITDKCVEGLKRVQSQYVVFCADDDYLFPDTVWDCVNFLEREPDYATAMGRTAQLNPKFPRWCCRVLKGYSIEHSRPFDRCRELAANWCTNFYAVYRTATMLDIFQITAANTNSSVNYHLPEMLFSQLSVLRGRVKIFPKMYSLMEKHSSNAGAAMRTGVRQDAESMYLRFKGCLVDQFVKAGTDRSESESFIDEEYGYFRETDLSIRRRPRSAADLVRHWFSGIAEKATPSASTGSNRHRRFVRTKDVESCGPVWNAAVQLLKQFPLGIPADQDDLKRCA